MTVTRWVGAMLAVAACSQSVVDEGGRPIGEPLDVTVGLPCLPSQEQNPDFAGFSVNEISLEWGNAMCGSGVCLVDRFQGRVTCPMGQAEPVGGEAECAASSEGVTQAVCAQCPSRPPSETVHCSCRCAMLPGDEEDPEMPLCSCPSGFSCEPIVAVGADGGGYCVKPKADADDCGVLDGYWSPECEGVPGP